MSAAPPPASWHGKLVRLRAVGAADWAIFHENDSDTEAARNGWRVHLPRSAASARSWADERAARPPGRGDDNWFWAIEDCGGVLAGSINTHGCDRLNGNFEYGVSVFREHWGKGYAAASIEIMLRFMFGERRYHKCNVWIYSFNARSLRMHEKFGFVQEARVRDQVFTAGRYHDSIGMGITAEEFFARYGR